MKKEISSQLKLLLCHSSRIFFILSLLLISCSRNEAINQSDKTKNIAIEEVRQTEAAFQAMTAEKGVAVAFEFFADSAAVIKRGEPEELLKGKAKIFEYYNQEGYKSAMVEWAPDFVETSSDGNLAYSYGKFTWKTKDDKGEITEYKGIYMTIWKRQSDKSWKYIWD